MTFRLSINLDNAAFDEPGELSRILVELADRLLYDSRETYQNIYQPVRDVNGNGVGVALVEES